MTTYNVGDLVLYRSRSPFGVGLVPDGAIGKIVRIEDPESVFSYKGRPYYVEFDLEPYNLPFPEWAGKFTGEAPESAGKEFMSSIRTNVGDGELEPLYDVPTAAIRYARIDAKELIDAVTSAIEWFRSGGSGTGKDATVVLDGIRLEHTPINSDFRLRFQVVPLSRRFHPVMLRPVFRFYPGNVYAFRGMVETEFNVEHITLFHNLLETFAPLAKTVTHGSGLSIYLELDPPEGLLGRKDITLPAGWDSLWTL